MENMYLKGIFLLLVSATVTVHLSDASCGGGSRQTCTNDDVCPDGWLCLEMDNEPGVKKCWNCGCNDTSQCEIVNGRLGCNCTQTGGYYGSFCQCPPVNNVACKDVLSAYGECNMFSSDQFEVKVDSIVDEDELNPLVSDFFINNGNVSPSDQCKAKCIENDCHLYSFGGGICFVFNKTDTMPLLNVVKHFIKDDGFKIYIRKCIDC